MRYPGWICFECGRAYGTYCVGTSTVHTGICGWCGREMGVTAARDFGYPQHPPEAKPRKRAGSKLGEQADRGELTGGGHRAGIKRAKRRGERRRAKANPETPPSYGKYRGYES